MTNPEPAPEPTDNRERPEDGEQDVSQDPELDYATVSEPDDDSDPSA